MPTGAQTVVGDLRPVQGSRHQRYTGYDTEDLIDHKIPRYDPSNLRQIRR